MQNEIKLENENNYEEEFNDLKEKEIVDIYYVPLYCLTETIKFHLEVDKGST